MIEDRHDGRTVIVTGAAEGIGRRMATRFAEEEADVAIADIRHEPKTPERFGLDEARLPTDELIEEEYGQDAIYVETDVSDPDSVENLVEETASTFGGIDVVCSNAGTFSEDDATETLDIDGWEGIIDVNLSGMFHCAKYAMPYLKESSGDIVNTGSNAGNQGGFGPAYSSSKGGVLNLTRDLAVEFGGDGVNVNAIAPGFTRTPMGAQIDEPTVMNILSEVPKGRLGRPQDIADAAVFLASDEADHITGHILYVDGGIYASCHGFMANDLSEEELRERANEAVDPQNLD
jgi:NAD(P)-dependent dehydrogenase (short-subunit alcohol dehydrogenase family)